MQTYMDIVMHNHKLKSNCDSSEENITKYYKSLVVKQKGGNPDNISDVLKNRATGSFPPLYKSNKTKIKKKEDPVDIRNFAKLNKTAISIKEIMEDRRNEDIKPFLTL